MSIFKALRAPKSRSTLPEHEPNPGRWPVGVWLGGENLLGTRLWTQHDPDPVMLAPQRDARADVACTPSETGAAELGRTEPPALLYFTDEGLSRPVLVFGRHGSGITTTLLRLLARAAEDPRRTLIYVDGAADTATQRRAIALMHAFGRSVAWSIAPSGATVRETAYGTCEAGPPLDEALAAQIEAAYLALPPSEHARSAALLHLLRGLLARGGRAPATLILERLDLTALIAADREPAVSSPEDDLSSLLPQRPRSGSLGEVLQRLPELAAHCGISAIVAVPSSASIGSALLDRFVQADSTLIIHATDAPEMALEFIVGDRPRVAVTLRTNAPREQLSEAAPPLAAQLMTTRAPRLSARLSLSLATGEARIAVRGRVAVAQIAPLEIGSATASGWQEERMHSL
ncbi:MAG: hypothetical protein KatS3mg057_1647 [Herpetosiphonaceae bacterium]|nr:MAG: hypothetical protein KatS3mg057_1647 [Herpetosiphonaceae bacterium]